MNLVKWITHYGEKKIPEELMRYYSTSGSGFDTPIKIDWVNSSKKKLTIWGTYHLLNDNGYYKGWVDYKVVFTPELSGVITPKLTVVCNARLKRLILERISYNFLELEIPPERLKEIE